MVMVQAECDEVSDCVVRGVTVEMVDVQWPTRLTADATQTVCIEKDRVREP
jgi:hypothetical protein